MHDDGDGDRSKYDEAVRSRTRTRSGSKGNNEVVAAVVAAAVMEEGGEGLLYQTTTVDTPRALGGRNRSISTF